MMLVSNRMVSMKSKSLIVATIVFAAFSLVSAEPVNWPVQPGSGRVATASLQLTVSVVQQESCEDGNVRIWLRARYTNAGSEPIILNRFSTSISEYTISKNEQAAAKGDHEKDVLRSILVTTPNPTHGRTPPEDSFIILKSGESYDIDAQLIGFLLIRKSEVGRFTKRNHVLQVHMLTWDEPISLARELSAVWHDYGVLWWEEIKSSPTPFKIEQSSSTVKCS
jgi:hypothetical protein